VHLLVTQFGFNILFSVNVCVVNFSGFIRGLPEELAISISFRPKFEEGSLLTVVRWVCHDATVW